MILTERTINIIDHESIMDSPVVLYRGDKNVELKLNIKSSRFKFRDDSSSNFIESAQASYGQLIIQTPNQNEPIFSEITATKKGYIIFVITAEMIDEIDEVGNYTFQVRLLDSNKRSRATIPPVVNGIEIREPITSEDSNVLNSAVVGLASAANEEVLDTFDFNGNYAKTNWKFGDKITAAKLNKSEDGIYQAYALGLNNSSQIKDKVNKGEGGVITNAMLSQEVKEAMTGGSVAVVGKNAILTENIVDKQVTPEKTSFCKVGLNKFNIDDVKFGVFADPRSGTLVETENSNYYTVEIEVLPQTQYLYAVLNTVKNAYVKTNGGFISFLDINKNLLSYINGYDTEYLETPENCYYIVHSAYSSLNYESLLDRQPMFVLKSVFDTISNMFGNYMPYKYILNQNIVEVENDINYIDNLNSTKTTEGLSANMGRELNEKINNILILTENIVDKQVTPGKTSFCEVGANKFNIDDVKFGVFADPRSGTLVETENSNYYTVEIEVLPQTQYLYAGLNTVKDAYVKTNGGFISFLDINKNLLSYINGYDTEYLETPENCYYVVHSVYSSFNYDQLKDRQPMFVPKSYFGTISNMFGNYIPYKYILNQNIVEVENDINYIDNLNSTDANAGLSANMGRELNEKINKISISSGNAWANKIGITYGDSITAINNPECPSELYGAQGKYASWGYYVKNHLGLNKLYGRGIGGQTYSWGSNGGSVAFINSDGSVHSRDDNFNYDNYTGEIPSGTTKVRGAFCSWSRITAMIPESMKNTIDFIFVMGGSNDIPGGGTALGDHTFVNENKTDVEWGNSSYYNGGDFDINTYIGGMCSTIMKLQIWCPNAVIIVGTPLNGRASSNPNSNENVWCKNALGLYYINYIEKQEKVLKDFGIPCIDVYGTCGINPFNRATYITDWVHPFSDKGCKALARAVIGGMKSIMPNI